VDMEPNFAYTYNVVSRADQTSCNVRLWPFPWGMDVKHPKTIDKDWADGADLHVAVVHRYIWDTDRTSYPGAPEDRHLKSYKFDPFDTAIFGDNHIAFSTRVGKTTVYNCGGFMRRNIDQREHLVYFGELRSGGGIAPHAYRPKDADKWVEQSVVNSLKEIANAASPAAKVEAVRQFIEEAGELLFDFKDLVAKFLKRTKLDEDVRKILEEVVK
jgi:hypothetical protein